MTARDIYGACAGLAIDNASNDANVDAVADTLRAELGVAFEGRESSFLNGAYARHRFDGRGSIRVLNNVTDDDPEDAVYLDFPEYAVLVEVVDPPAPDELRETLLGVGLIHLRRDEA